MSSKNLANIAISLKTDQIKQGIKDLKELQKVGEQVEKSLGAIASQQLVTAQKKVNAETDKATTSTKKQKTAVDDLTKAQNKQARELNAKARLLRAETSYKKASIAAENQLTRAVKNSSKALSGHTQGAMASAVASDKLRLAVSGVARVMGNFSTYTLPALGALAVHNFMIAADSVTKIESQLKLVTSSTEELGDAFERIRQISVNTYSSMQANAKLFTAMDGVMKDMGRGRSDTLAFIQTFQKTLALTNPTIKEAESATLQFVQAMGSGVLRGEEFNSIMENGRGVAMMLAEALDVNVGQLRSMAHEGQLTADVVVNALEKMSGKVDGIFADRAMTLQQAYQNLGTASLNAIGKFNKSFGEAIDTLNVFSDTQSKAKTATDKLAVSINHFAMGIDEIDESMFSAVTTLTLVATSFYGIKKALPLIALGKASLGMIKLAKNADKFATAGNVVTSVVTGIDVGSKKAAKSVRLLNTALAFISRHPIALAFTAVGVALTYITSQGEDAAESLKKLNNELDRVYTKDSQKIIKSNPEIVAQMQKVIAMREELAEKEASENTNYEYRIKLLKNYIPYHEQVLENMIAQAKANEGIQIAWEKQHKKKEESEKKSAKLRAEGLEVYRKIGTQLWEQEYLSQESNIDLEMRKFRLSEDYLKMVEAGQEGFAEQLASQKRAILEREEAQRREEKLTNELFDIDEQRTEDIFKRSKELSAQRQKDIKEQARLKEEAQRREEKLDAELVAIAEAENDAILRRSDELAEKEENAYQRKLALQYAYDSMVMDGEIARDESIERYMDSIDELSLSVQSIGDAWLDTGDAASKAIGAMMKTHQEFADQYENASKDQKKLDDATFENQQKYQDGAIDYSDFKTAQGKIDEKQDKLKAKNLDNQLNYYSSLASGIKNMAEEGSSAARLAMAAEQALAVTQGIRAVIRAWGDPYPLNLVSVPLTIANVGSLLGQMGTSLNGGGSPTASYAQVQDSGSGVLGGGKSESWDNFNERLVDLGADQYQELRAINENTRFLNNAMVSTSSALYSSGTLGNLSTDLSSFSASSAVSFVDGITNAISDIPVLGLVGGAIGGLISNIAGAIFGGGTSLTSVGYGLNVGGALDNVGVGGYQTIKKHTDGGWFGKSKTSYYDTSASVDPQVQQALGSTFNYLGNIFEDLSQVLEKDVSSQIDNLSVSIGKIALQGKSSEEVQQALTDAISQQSDRWAYDLFGDLINKYQKVEESAFDTLNRLAIEKVVVEDILDTTGFNVDAFTNNAIAVTQALVNIAGGVEELKDVSEVYYDNFFSKQEQFTDLTENLIETLGYYNMLLPATREGYRDLVEGLDLTTASGQNAYVSLLKASSSADEYYQHIEDLEKDRLDSVKSLADIIYDTVDGITESAKQAIKSLTETVVDSTRKRSSVLNEANQIIAMLQAGKLPSSNDTNAIISSLSSVDSGNFASKEDYLRATMENVNLLKDIEELSGGYVDINQQQLEALIEIRDYVGKSNKHLTLSNFLADFNGKLSANKLVNIFHELDKNGDGTINQLESMYAENVIQNSLTSDLQDSGDLNNKLLSINNDTTDYGLSQIVTEAYGNARALSEVFANSATAQLKGFELVVDNLGNNITNALNVIAGNTNATHTLLAQIANTPASGGGGSRVGFFQSLGGAVGGLVDTVTSGISDVFAFKFSEGGYTGAGHSEEVAGIVHKGEYVIPKWMTSANPDLINTLEATRVNGSHATGLDYVPFNGYRAELHKGEMVVPSGQADYLRMGVLQEQISRLADKLDDLILQNRQVGIQTIKNVKKQTDILDKWDIIGQPEVRA